MRKVIFFPILAVAAVFGVMGAINSHSFQLPERLVFASSSLDERLNPSPAIDRFSIGLLRQARAMTITVLPLMEAGSSEKVISVRTAWRESHDALWTKLMDDLNPVLASREFAALRGPLESLRMAHLQLQMNSGVMTDVQSMRPYWVAMEEYLMRLMALRRAAGMDSLEGIIQHEEALIRREGGFIRQGETLRGI